MVKRYYKLHVRNIKQQLEEVRELGTASADEWSKGLAEEGKERIADAVRWEQWEAKGGLKKVNMRPQTKATVPWTIKADTPNLPPKPQNSVHSDVWAPQHVPIDPRYDGQLSNGLMTSVELHQYPYNAAGNCFPW